MVKVFPCVFKSAIAHQNQAKDKAFTVTRSNKKYTREASQAYQSVQRKKEGEKRKLGGKRKMTFQEVWA